MKRSHLLLALVLPPAAALLFWAARSAPSAGEEAVELPHTFQAGTVARASEVNANFSALAEAIAAIPRPANVVSVAKAGGEFSSVARALASIADASPENPYVVLVFPGIYEENDLLRIPSGVHLKGAGRESTIIRSRRSGAVAGEEDPPEAGAAVQLEDRARLSDVTIINRGNGGFSFGVYSIGSGRETLIENAAIHASGEGGGFHDAVLAVSSDLTIRGSELVASGAQAINRAFRSQVSNGAGPARPHIERSELRGKSLLAEGGGGAATGPCDESRGVGLQLADSAAEISDSAIRGDCHAITASGSAVAKLSTAPRKRVSISNIR
jgi:hypothetical protein